MTGELAALGTAVLWALGNLTLKPVADRYHFLTLNTVRTLAAAAVTWVVLVSLGRLHTLAEFPASNLAQVVASAVIGIGVGDSLYYAGVARMPIAPAYTVSQASYPLFAVVIAILFLGERLGVVEGVGAACVVVGILLVSWPSHNTAAAREAEGASWRLGLALVVASSVVWAIAIAWAKDALEQYDPTAALAARLTFVAGLLWAATRLRPRPAQSGPWPRGSAALNAWGGGAVNALGAVLFFYSFQRAGVAKASVISGLSPLFLVALAVAFLKERPTRLFLAGTALSVAGVALLV